jgi:hypothetical protein
MIAQAKKNRDDLETQDKAADEVIDKYGARSRMAKLLSGPEEVANWMLGQGFSTSDKNALQAALDTKKNIEGLRAGYTSEIKQGEDKKEELDSTAEIAKNEYEAAKQRYDDLLKRLHDLEITLENLKGEKAAQQAKNDAIIPLHNQTAETRARGDVAAEEMKRDEARRKKETEAGWMDSGFAATPSGQVDQAVIAADAALTNAQRGLDPSGEQKTVAIDRLIDLVHNLQGKTDAEDAALRQRIEQLGGTAPPPPVAAPQPPGIPQGNQHDPSAAAHAESEHWVTYGENLVTAAQSGRYVAESAVHATIAKLGAVLEEHVSRTDADAAALREAQDRLSRLEMRLQHNRSGRE